MEFEQKEAARIRKDESKVETTTETVMLDEKLVDKSMKGAKLEMKIEKLKVELEAKCAAYVLLAKRYRKIQSKIVKERQKLFMQCRQFKRAYEAKIRSLVMRLRKGVQIKDCLIGKLKAAYAEQIMLKKEYRKLLATAEQQKGELEVVVTSIKNGDAFSSVAIERKIDLIKKQYMTNVNELEREKNTHLAKLRAMVAEIASTYDKTINLRQSVFDEEVSQLDSLRTMIRTEFDGVDMQKFEAKIAEWRRNYKGFSLVGDNKEIAVADMLGDCTVAYEKSVGDDLAYEKEVQDVEYELDINQTGLEYYAELMSEEVIVSSTPGGAASGAPPL